MCRVENLAVVKFPTFRINRNIQVEEAHVPNKTNHGYPVLWSMLAGNSNLLFGPCLGTV